MTKLSVTIITLNEERNIARCVESVKEIADEIVVVDSFSTDKTKEICLSKGVKVLEKTWSGYSDAKNYGAMKATHDYILNLDADEVLSEELKNSILEEKQKGLHGIYKFNRLTNYCGKWIHHCGWYPDRKPRLYPKSDAEWDKYAVHEKLILKNPTPILLLKGDLHHYSFYTVEEHRMKAQKYAALSAQNIIQRKKKFLLLRMVFNPFFRFIKMYFFQQGFLDGHYGFLICLIASKEVFLKYKLAIQSGK